MKDNAVSARTREVADEVEALRRTIEERMPIPVADPRGYVSEPALPSAAMLGLSFCHDYETGESLAKLLKRVPAEYVTEQAVQCLCGAEVVRARLWTECPGECGRLFIADEFGAYAVRLPETA